MRGDLRVPDLTEREQTHAGREHGLRAHPRDERLGGTGGEHRRPRGGEEGDAGLERRVAEHVLHVQGEEEEAPEDRASQQEADGVRRGDQPAAEDPERHERVRRARLDGEEERSQDGGDDQQDDRARACPADVRRLRDCVDEQDQGGRDRDRARHVVVAVAEVGAALGHEPQRQREAGGTDGHVDEEDPLPAEELGQDPARDHADSGAAPTDGSVDAERLVALRALLEEGHDDREDGR